MSESTREWVNFFLKAGVPSDEAATYALIFYKHRIQKNMLIDLNKEYLRDMGITPLGDIIAILKHAKTVHDSTSRAMIMSEAITAVTKSSSGSSSPLSNAPASSGRRTQDLTSPARTVEESVPGVLATKKNLPSSSRAVQQRVKVLPPAKPSVPNPSVSRMEPQIKQERESDPESDDSGFPFSFLPAAKRSDPPQAQRAAEPGSPKTTTRPTPKKCVFSRLGGAAPDAEKASPIKGTASITKRPVQKMDTPKNKVVPASVELKKIRITTQFSDDDDVEINSQPGPSLVRKPAKEVTPKLIRKRMYSDDVEHPAPTDEISPSSAKKVRFGTTSTRTFPVKGSINTTTVFRGHTVVVKNPSQTEAKIAITQQPTIIARKAERRITPTVGIRTRVGVVKPTPAKPMFSKMVSDTLLSKGDVYKKAVKNRVDLKAKGNKSSVLDRLG